ncbi:MAG: energy coupling factor transporter S component ThiW [Saccharofermentans sp.]|nr:energy coupling factor transporter S component ThiW [Saccharofermentans sp.]
MKRYNILRMVVMAMLIAVGVVISPLLRVEGMCPMAHLINITAAVLLGPVDAFIVAVLIGIIRMCGMGIPPLALTGAVFGATLSGILYKVSKGKIWAAVLGEIIGTGIIGAIVSYPVMTYICGREGLTWLFYVPSFTCGTLIGGSIAAVLLYRLQHIGVLSKMQMKLKEGGKVWHRKAQEKTI